MNLWFRLLFTLLAGRWRTPCGSLDACATPFRVLPTDLDTLGHVNNGVYFKLMDLARVDYLLRARLWDDFKKRGWFPVVAAETIQFHRDLRLLQKFFIETQLIGVDTRSFYIAQRVIRERGGRPVAEAVVRGLLVKRGGTVVPMSELLEAVGNPSFPEPMANWILEWGRALDSRRKELQGAARRQPA